MESGAHLRAVRNRKITIVGDHNTNQSRSAILLTTFEAKDSEGKSRKILKEGDIVTLTTNASISSLDRVLTLRANPALYAAGNVRIIPLIAPDDELAPVTIQFQAADRIDLSKLSHLVEVYVNSNGGNN